MTRFFVCISGLALASIGLLAGGTRYWEHTAESDFEKGTLKKLSLRSDGRLSLAPVFKELHDTSTNYLWAVAEDSKKNLYVGGSGQDAKAKLFQIDSTGKGKVLAELAGLEVHAIAVDASDRVYAATAPDGKVYRINAAGSAASGSAEVFYDPKAKYIWALVFDKQGNLYVATGDKGEVHRVTPAGSGSVFYRTEETHARALVLDSQGNLYAGTEPGGMIYKITPGGQGFVLYQTAKREITALATDPKGNVYAAAVGNKTTQPAPPPPQAPTPQPVPATGAAGPRPAPAPQPAPIPSLGASVSGGSEVIRLETDGYPRKLWSHQSEIAYSLAFDPNGRPLIGTGNRGNIYRLDSDLLSTLLLNSTPTQITALLAGRDNRVYAVTGNIGKVYQLGPEFEKEGTYESEALDATFFSYWGRVEYQGEVKGGEVKLDTRSGNVDSPARSWSPWAPVPLNSQGGRIASPAARFLQYKLTLAASTDGRTPEVASISTAFLPKNVAPVVELIEVTPANYRFPAPSAALGPSQNLTLPTLTRNPRPPSPPSLSADQPSNSMSYAKGHKGARWLARDDNGDQLLFKLEIRGVKETSWKLLKDEIRERNFSWDTAPFPDGQYVLRITSTDAASNPPHQALTASLESDSFTLDNTPPRITGLAGVRSGSRLEVKFHASDALTVISKAEYSINGGDWKAVEPTTRLTDSLDHDYVLTLDSAPSGEVTVAVRVQDDHDNQAVEKVVVR